MKPPSQWGGTESRRLELRGGWGEYEKGLNFPLNGELALKAEGLNRGGVGRV